MNCCSSIIRRVSVFFCFFFLLSSFVAVGAFTGENPASDQSQKLENVYKQILGQIQQLEDTNPQQQASYFKLRALVDNLYRVKSSNEGNSASQNSLTDSRENLGQDREDPFLSCGNLAGRDLIVTLKKLIQGNLFLEYGTAREKIFCDVHNFNGEVECVYTGRKIVTNHLPPATNMNIEHTWPQSLGATGIAKSDLHHLFPTDSNANGRRGSLPFGEVRNPNWEEGGSKCDGSEFEVRDNFKGNVARAKFYFAVRYDKSIPADEEAALRKWNQDDPVDATELERNNKIEKIQNNRNPFIDHPEFVGQISDF
ncbi:MAG: endonuclease [Candidatus Riflebacteria bacterium]|nr:endonuclease [Candidatus Riflebacteria bacterium]